MAKRGLVVGHLEGVSGELLEEYPKAVRQLIRGRSGVYALYRNQSLYYVGLARNLMGRVRSHLKDRHVGRWNRFSVYLTRHDDHVKELESLLLRIVAPKGNRQSGKFPGSVDLKRVTSQLIREEDDDQRAHLLGGQAASRRIRAKVTRNKGVAAISEVLKKRIALRSSYQGQEYRASLRKDGSVSFAGKTYTSLSAAAAGVRKKPTNGWAFWRYQDKHREWVRISTLRK
jgi:hypothetical protein